ncbi:CHRD domain-containing protein [Noviherbaspirillum aridicola]|nr:CHRD domain-containing protein [Noviherbaspirillum aridicola]
MRSLFQRLLALLCAALLVSACGGGHDDEVPLVRSTILSGEEIIPRNISTALASGTVTLAWDDNVLLASVFVSDVIPTAVHLHHAPPDSIGLTVLELQRVGTSAVWQGSAPLTDEQIRALRFGNFYLDVHTLAYPSGELRGQLFDAFPPQEHVSALQQLASQSPLLSEQLRQLEDYEDWWHDDHSGVGIGLGLAFGF